MNDMKKSAVLIFPGTLSVKNEKYYDSPAHKYILYQGTAIKHNNLIMYGVACVSIWDFPLWRSYPTF